MNLALSLLVSDGYYVFNEYLKLSFIGLIFLIYFSIFKEKTGPKPLVFFFIFLTIGLAACLASMAAINARYFLSQTALLLACYSIYHLSNKRKLTIVQLEKFAKIFVLISTINYVVIVIGGVDPINSLMNSFASPSTSRHSLETFFGYRVQRLYFLSSEPSTHALTVFALFSILNLNRRLTTLWRLVFFINILATFSLTALCLFFSHYFFSRKIFIAVAIVLLTQWGVFSQIDEFSTIAKLLQIGSDVRVLQFYIAHDMIQLYPVSLDVVKSQEIQILSLWLLFFIANGYIVGFAFLSSLFLPNIYFRHKAWFLLIFLVIPISYFLAASFLWWKRGDETSHTLQR